MEFNRLISLVIGFIVLILVFVWIGSRFRSATKDEANSTVTITVTPTATKAPAEESEVEGGQGWNPFAFLFNRDNSPTPTPSKAVAKKTSITPSVTSTQTGNGTVQGSNGQTGTQQVQEDPGTVIVYKNNRTGETQTINQTVTKGGIKQIPETGSPTLLIPIALSALTLGAYLKKRV